MIRLIAAVDNHLGLAKNGHQPWKLPADEKYFLDQTQKHGGVVLMGRTTYQVIGHALRNRRNIVLTRSGQTFPGAETFADLQQALQSAPDIWVIGGQSIYEQTLAYADEIYLTHIQANFDCDQFFPQFADKFEQTSQSQVQHENNLDFVYSVYRKKP